jgi:hypothetical protein
MRMIGEPLGMVKSTGSKKGQNPTLFDVVGLEWTGTPRRKRRVMIRFPPISMANNVYANNTVL